MILGVDMDRSDREKILEEKKNVTSRISDTCRYIGFGLLAVYYTIMSGDNSFATNLQSGALTYWALQGIGIAGAVAILFDYLQYFFGSRAVEEALASETHQYNEDSCAYRARRLFYNLKQCSVGAGAVLLLFVVVFATAATKPPVIGPKSSLSCALETSSSSCANA